MAGARAWCGEHKFVTTSTPCPTSPTFLSNDPPSLPLLSRSPSSEGFLHLPPILLSGMMRVTLNLGDFDSAQNEIPPPQQLISNVDPWLMEKATGYHVVVGIFCYRL